MSKRMIKTAISALKEFRRGEIKELLIHIETTSGEILNCDIDMEDDGEITTEYLAFKNDEEYELFLNSDNEIPENILYN
tara:strand:+ start:158 stop:394 length:237 start_codon:yes stop_codon:yes gene_type:complete